MRRLISAAMAVTIVSLAAAACGPAQETPREDAQPVAAPTQPLDITFRTEPAPPKAGETAIDVTVRGANGEPVTDADVSVEFYMAAMPEVKMAEMRNTVPLRHEAGGRYRGKGNIMMAGKWDVTVTVKRGAEEIGKRTVSVTAQ